MEENSFNQPANSRPMNGASFSISNTSNGSPLSISRSSNQSGILVSTPLPHSSSTTLCQICMLTSHTAGHCPNRFNHAYVTNELPRSFCAMSISETSDTAWYPDTGASAHMTSDEGNL